MWTVEREYDQPIQHMDLKRSGGSFVANLTIRVAPDLENPGVSFANAVADQAATPFIPFVEAGVLSFVAQRATDGRPVGFLRVTLTAITIHPVDAKSHRFVEAAKMALSQAFEVVGVEL
jgi:hypothetical protein